MAFTFLFLAAWLVALVLVSGVAYLLKGLEAALIAAGTVLLLAAVTFVAIVNLITAAM